MAATSISTPKAMPPNQAIASTAGPRTSADASLMPRSDIFFGEGSAFAMMRAERQYALALKPPYRRSLAPKQSRASLNAAASKSGQSRSQK